MKQCFDAQDVPKLQELIARMPESEAVYYMKRCVDAGLWVPQKKDEEGEGRMKEKEEETEETNATDDVD